MIQKELPFSLTDRSVPQPVLGTRDEPPTIKPLQNIWGVSCNLTLEVGLEIMSVPVQI